MSALTSLPGGPLDEGQQLGVRIAFSGNGDREALGKAFASKGLLLGCQFSGDQAPLNMTASGEKKTETLTTLFAMQAPAALELLVEHGFEIESVAPNMIPPQHYMLVLTGPTGTGKSAMFEAVRALLRDGNPVEALTPESAHGEADKPWATLLYRTDTPKDE